ncbi:hypothetical protein, partial [Burkholderia ubonensis]|uniref:hypothetical protein n=1 Tax=Burkholderia ubonensis TaxID=101571 RepID=UPI000ABF37C3
MGIHRYSIDGRPVEGVYAFRDDPKKPAHDVLYTPGAPDGRIFRPYADAAKRPGGFRFDSTEERKEWRAGMDEYFLARVKILRFPKEMSYGRVLAFGLAKEGFHQCGQLLDSAQSA